MIDYKNLKMGDVFYEYNPYAAGTLMYTVTEEPESQLVDLLGNDMTQWKWVGTDENGNKRNFLVTEGLEHYGPKLSYEPDYM